jgi:hypothetical protein
MEQLILYNIFIAENLTRRHKDTKEDAESIILSFTFVAANRRFDVYSVPL